MLRKRITLEPVLKQPQLEQQFKVEVDASVLRSSGAFGST